MSTLAGLAVGALVVLSSCSTTPTQTVAPSPDHYCVTPGCPVELVTDPHPPNQLGGCIMLEVSGVVVAREGQHVSMEGGGTMNYDFICDPEFEAG